MNPSEESKLLERIATQDRRMMAAVKPIRMLSAVSWPASAQQDFITRWQSGNARLPKIEYARVNLSAVHSELNAVREALQDLRHHEVANYVYRTAVSNQIAARLVESVGSEEVTEHSIQLFGRPGDLLPGAEVNNIEAARHFISLADDLSHSLTHSESDYCIPAYVLQAELQIEIDRFFINDKVRVEIDDNLISKAAAGTSRIRLRGATAFSEYDRAQLLYHEAFVHTLTSINGQAQPNLVSLGSNSPRITATQEGLATFAELITGSIDIARMKRISLRIIAIDMALKGADFIDVFKFFLQSGQTESESFSSASRVFRGVPVTGGYAFTKDTVYLHGLLSIHTFFRWALKHQKLNLCRNLFAGKMTLGDVITLEPWFDSGFIAQPKYVPPWAQRAGGLAGVLAFSLFANRIRLDRVDEDDLVLAV